MLIVIAVDLGFSTCLWATEELLAGHGQVLSKLSTFLHLESF